MNGKTVDISQLGASYSQPATQLASRAAIALLPFTPVPFVGDGAIFAWGRMVLFGGLAVMMYNKHKTAATVLGGAAVLSVATSLSASLWNKS